MPWKVYEEEGEYCIHKLNPDNSMGEKVVCHPTQAEADTQVKAMYANEGMMTRDILFVDLADLQIGKPIDGLAVGTFIPMSGEEVTFDAKDLPTYIQNTQRLIESTKTESGEIVGLPIDKNRHDHEGGAGWIIGLELDKARNIIKFIVNWTEEGINLISKNIRRFFSPSVNDFKKVILGGSLTNNPATRSDDQMYLLRPVELSQSIKELDMPNILEQVQELIDNAIDKAIGKKADPPPADPATPPAPPAPVDLSNVVNPSLKSLYTDDAQLAQLESNVQEIVSQRVNAEMRKKHTENFVAELIGGTKTRPYGFAVRSKDLLAWMLSLSDAQAKFAEKLLSEMRNKAIDFAEHGFDNSDGFIQLPALPKEILPLAREWMKVEGNTIQEFFRVNPEIGNIDNFNIAEFVKAKE